MWYAKDGTLYVLITRWSFYPLNDKQWVRKHVDAQLNLPLRVPTNGTLRSLHQKDLTVPFGSRQMGRYENYNYKICGPLRVLTNGTLESLHKRDLPVPFVSRQIRR